MPIETVTYASILCFLSIAFEFALRNFRVVNPTGVKVTFFVNPPAIKARLDGWKRAVASGKEVGSHSISHPCTGNFPWSRQNALEDYTLERMSQQLDEANAQIKELLGVDAVTFAYSCGQKFVGRGPERRATCR